MKSIKSLTIIYLLLIAMTPLISQDIRGEDLEIRLLVVGQGDPVYSLWGHTGLAIKNLDNGKDIFYDFGNFNFEDDSFFANFAVGRLLYIAWAAYTEQYIFSVINEKRDLTEYVLNLSPGSKLEMYEALKTKALPENRTYLYHHYHDNCSTRIRDYIDIALDGQLKETTDYSRGSTFRKSFLRFTSNKKMIGSALSMLQGPMIDKEVTLWQEMFLPEVLGEVAADFSYKNDRGETIALVKSKNVLYGADHRSPLPEKYEAPYAASLIISIILSSLILYVNFRTKRNKHGLFSLASIVIAFILGFLGSVLLFLAAFTDHSYAFNNINLFMINPLALFIIPAAIMYWKKGKKWKNRLDILWLLQAGSALLMILLKVFTPVKQDNLNEIILILPVLISFTPIIPHYLGKKDSIEAAL